MAANLRWAHCGKKKVSHILRNSEICRKNSIKYGMMSLRAEKINVAKAAVLKLIYLP